MKTANIYLADGFEDIEALGTRDILVRGGMDVKTVSINEHLDVRSSRGLSVQGDLTLDQDREADIMIFPGGMPGAKNLGECRELMKRMNSHYAAGGYLAAICAAPKFVLANLDIDFSLLDFTCYDGCEDTLVGKGARFHMDAACVSQKIVTGRGPGHTFDFAFAILEQLESPETAASIAADMILEVGE